MLVPPLIQFGRGVRLGPARKPAAAAPGRGGVLLSAPVRRWECYGCDQTKVTREARPHTPFHTCRNGLTTPFVPEGERRKVTVNEREDYVGKETVTRDNDGNVPMNVTVERPDGTDVAVYAPCATASVGDLA